jgi:hypothetical protein
LSTVALSALALTAFGCFAGPGGQDVDPAAPASDVAAVPHEHLMLTDQARALREVPLDQLPEGKAERAATTLKYYGGPVLQKANVVPVYWTSAVNYQSNLNTFYAALTSTSFMAFFTQYNTTSPAQTISAGTVAAPYVDNDTATNVTDAMVQAELNRLFTAGSLPAPTANNLYMVHFPPGVTVTDSGGSKSCVVFCAYHGTYVRNGQNVYYGIIPDQGGGCATGCGGNATPVNNLTSVVSHEYSEAVTDAAVGIATTFAPPLAWYNSSKGEIGDICNGQQGSKSYNGATWVVQKEYSNSAHACVIP